MLNFRNSIGGFGGSVLEELLTKLRMLQRMKAPPSVIQPILLQIQRLKARAKPPPIPVPPPILPVPPPKPKLPIIPSTPTIPKTPIVKPLPQYNHIPIPPEKRARMLPIIIPKVKPIVIPIIRPVTPMPIPIPSPDTPVGVSKVTVPVPFPVMPKVEPSRAGLFGRINVPMIVGSVSALLVIGLVFSRMQKRKGPK